MEKVVIQDYFWFGTAVRYLQDAKKDHVLQGSGRIVENLAQFFRILDELSLSVTKRASYELRQFYEEVKASAIDAKLTDVQAKKLSDLMTDVRKTLSAELQGMEAFIVSPTVALR